MKVTVEVSDEELKDILRVTVEKRKGAYSPAITPHGPTVFVANFGSNTISKAATATNTTAATLDKSLVGPLSGNFAISPNGIQPQAQCLPRVLDENNQFHIIA